MNVPDSRSAEEILAEHVEGLARGGEVDVEGLCTRHPDKAAEIRALVEEWRPALDALLDQRKLGDSTIVFDTSPIQDSLGSTDDLVERLRNRKGNESRYRILGEYARGGMGAILKVWDADLRRTSAMKVILHADIHRAGMTNSQADTLLVRFLREAQITGQLEHPGIIAIHELGVDPSGRVYFTMPLVQGRSLERVFELVAEGREEWTRTRALGAILRVCETMAFAHSKGVIHRDLKPANIMIGRFGETYVMDWGLARVVRLQDAPRLPGESALDDHIDSLSAESALLDAGHASATQAGSVVGSPFYMAPEQAAGRIDEVGTHSDVYSVGAVLYQLFAGRPPYGEDRRASTVEVMGRVLAGPPAPLHEVVAGVPPELEAICRKAMAYRWQERYPSIVELAVDLRAYLEGRVVGAYSTTPWQMLRKWVVRNRTAAALVALLALVVLASAAFMFDQQRRQLDGIRAEQGRTADALALAEKNERDALANAERARAESYQANLVAAQASLRANEILDVKRRLDLCPEKLRGWEWDHLHLAVEASRRVFGPFEGGATSLAAITSGTTVVVGTGQGRLVGFDVEEGKRLFDVAAHTTGVLASCVALDGRIFTVGEYPEDELRSFLASDGRPVGNLKLQVAAEGCAAFSPDGSMLAHASSDDVVSIVNTANGRTVRSLAGHGGSVVAIQFSADGALLLTACEDEVIRVWSLDQDEPIFSVEWPGEVVHAAAFHPDGSVFFVGATSGAIREWSLSGKAGREFVAHDDQVLALRIDASGKVLVSAGHDKTVRTWIVATGELALELRGHHDVVTSVAFSTSAEQFFTCSRDGSIRLWDTTAGTSEDFLEGAGDFANALDISADGARTAAAWFGEIRVFEGPSLRATAEREGDELVNSLAFSPDGSLLAAGLDSAAIELLDARTLELVAILTESSASLTGVAFAPGGALLASTSANGVVRIWDVAAETCVVSFESGAATTPALAFSPDGLTLAVGTDTGQILRWNTADWTALPQLDGNLNGVYSLRFSRSGAHLAAGCGDYAVRVWTIADPHAPLVLSGHGHRVTSLDFDADDTRLFSGSYDMTVRAWRLPEGEPLLTLRSDDGSVTGVRFRTSDRRLVVSSFDGTVRVWSSR